MPATQELEARRRPRRSAGGRWPRRARAKTKAATTRAASAGRTLRPRPRRTHWALVRGLAGMRPRARATASRKTRYGQKRTAGPQAGPRVARSQRSGGRVSCWRDVDGGAREGDARQAVEDAHAAGLLPADLERVAARGDGHAELALLGARRAVLAVDRDLLDLGLRRDAQDEGLLAAAAGGGDEADALEAAAGGGLEGHVVDREGLALDALRVGEADGDRLARPGTVLGSEDALGEARDGREAGGGAGPDRAAPQPPHLGPRAALGRAQDDLRGLLERRLPARPRSRRRRGSPPPRPSRRRGWRGWAPRRGEAARAARSARPRASRGGRASRRST